MDWPRILAYVTGTVDQGLPARNEYLATENRILKHQLKGRLMLSDAERATLGEIGHRWVARFSPRSQPSAGRTRSCRGTASWPTRKISASP
jgi:hypothetical protein